MPYKVGGDNLPDNVKKMPANKQKQWVSVFNSALKKHGDESKAFAMANGVAKKTKSFTEDVWSTWEVDKRLVSQKAAEYNPFGAEGDKGCATCQWFISPNSCMLVQGDISPGGISKFFTAASEVTDEPVPINVYVVNDDKESDSEAAVVETEKAASGAGVFKSTFDWFMTRMGLRDSKELQPLWIDKGIDGAQWRVYLVYSNSFKDKTSETIVEAAHKEYVEWATKNNVYPELQLWHAGPDSKWGQVDFLDYVNGFAISSALVDKGKESVAEALEVEAKQGNLKVSHGYWGLKSAGGDYLLYRDFEQSPLPAKSEANSWTGIGFDVFAAKENDMAFTPAKRQWLKDIAGKTDAEIDTWEASLKQAETSLAGAGIARKEGEPAGAATGAPTTGIQVAGEGAAATDPVGAVVLQMKELGETMGNVLTVVQANKADLEGKIGKVVEAVGVIAAQVKKSQDDIVAEAYKSLAQRAGTGYVASEQAPGTVATKEASAAPEDDWFGKTVLADFKVAGAEAVATPGQAASLDNAGMGVQVPAGAGASATTGGN